MEMVHILNFITLSLVQACPSEIDNIGNCTTPLIWVELGSVTKLTFAEFVQILPQLVVVLFIAWGIKQMLRMIFNR